MKFYFILLDLTLEKCVSTNHLSLLFDICPLRVHQMVCIVVGGPACVVLQLTLHDLYSNTHRVSPCSPVGFYMSAVSQLHPYDVLESVTVP